MKQWTVRMRVEKIESWTVEAATSEEALERAMACDNIDEQFSELVNWEALSAKEDA